VELNLFWPDILLRSEVLEVDVRGSLNLFLFFRDRGGAGRLTMLSLSEFSFIVSTGGSGKMESEKALLLDVPSVRVVIAEFLNVLLTGFAGT